MLPTTSRYISLAEFLLVAATFAGSITSAAILTTPTLPEYVSTLLGYASALFLSSVTGIFPLILVLQRFQDDQAPDHGYYWVVITGLVVAALTVGAAFIILIVALKWYISKGAFILGATLTAFNVLWTMVMGLWNLYTVTEARVRRLIRRGAPGGSR